MAVRCKYNLATLLLLHAGVLLGLSCLSAQLVAEEQNALIIPELETPAAEEISTGTPELVTPDVEPVADEEVEAAIHLNVGNSTESESAAFGDWLGYNSKQSDTTWIANKDFGMFSLEDYPTLEINKESSLLIGSGFHFLNGPLSPDLPPRLFDFQFAFQTRQVISQGLVIDIKTSIGAFSDFEGSARKGIRFPGHVVSYYELQPRLVSVFGVEVLDRDDVSLLPVAGCVWRPNENFICELVFPRPSLQVQLDKDYVVYLSGELGGGTWATERADLTDDNVTYRDYRATLGIRSADNNSAIEIGWAFDRELDFRSGVGDSDFDDALLLRFRSYF